MDVPNIIEKPLEFLNRKKKLLAVVAILVVLFCIISYFIYKRKKGFSPKSPLKNTPPITSPFGENRGGTPHNGTDYGVATGTEVYAIERGEVVQIGTNCTEGNFECNGGRGNFVKIKHENGFASIYLHLSKVLVSLKDKVSKGQKIGLSGNTGHSTGAHLHVSVTDTAGVYVDVQKLIS